MRFAILLILALSRCFAALCQQQYFFQHITPEDGLSGNPNTNIYQDKEGYYWFNSVQGLQRYDGRDFVTFRYEYKRKGDLLDNSTINPVEDREGNIWTWNQEGISIFSKKKARLERFYLPDAPDSNTGNISNILRGNDGRLWIVTGRDIFLYDDSLRQPKAVYYGNEDPDGIPCLTRRRNGIWVVLNRGPHAFRFFDCLSQTNGSSDNPEH